MKTVPVFLAADDKFIRYGACMMASVCFNTKSFIDFYVLDGGISDENKKRVEKLKEKFNNFSVEFISIDTNTVFKDFKKLNCINLNMYSRFLIPDLKKDIKKAIYLDCDLLVLDDIFLLYDCELENYDIAAVKDRCALDMILKSKENLNIDKNHSYFNSGVLVINCKNWRDKNIKEKLFELEKKYRQLLQFPDQDILNKCFENNYLKLPFKFNVETGYSSFYEGEIVIRHFVGVTKPWKTDVAFSSSKVFEIENCADFWKYAKMTEFYDELNDEFLKIKKQNRLMGVLSKMAQKKEQKPLISVIIPVRNGVNYLKDAIESVRNQKMNTEIIVVDDGSNDSSADLALSLNVEKCISIPPSGLSKARNTGLKEAKGDYIMFLDHDDIINDNALSVLLKQFEKDSSIKCAAAKLLDFISPELSQKESALLSLRIEPYGGLLTGAMLFKREVFDIAGNFDENLQTGQGVDFLLRIKEKGIKTTELNFISAKRRLHNTNMGRSLKMQEKKDYANILRAKILKTQSK